MDKYNVVIDTNVIVSVLISHKKESSTYKVLELDLIIVGCKTNY